MGTVDAPMIASRMMSMSLPVEVHHRARAVRDREQKLAHFLIYREGDGGITDVRVDLDRRDLADAHGLELAGEVVSVGSDDEPAACDFDADALRVDGFALGDESHGGCDLAVEHEPHLGIGGTACRYRYLRLPSPVRTGSDSTGVFSAHAPRRCGEGAPRSVGEF
jgi:hypothetical protein